MLSWTVSFGLCPDTWDNLQLDRADCAGRAGRNQVVPSTEGEWGDWAKHELRVPWHRLGSAGTEVWGVGQQPSGGVKSLAHLLCNARRWPVKVIYSGISELYVAGLWVFFLCNPSSPPCSTTRAHLVAQVRHRTSKETLLQHLPLEVKSYSSDHL